MKFNTVEEAIEYLHREVRVQREIREDVAGKIFEWCKRNGFIVASFEWAELQGGTRGKILAITDIILEYEDSRGVVIRVERELPEWLKFKWANNPCITSQDDVDKAFTFDIAEDAGLVFTESLIEGGV